MDSQVIKVRVNFDAAEFELEGADEIVEKYLDRFAELIERLEDRPVGRRNESESNTPNPQLPEAVSQVPPEFGEYLSRFPGSITDVDRVLLAGFFVQSHTEDRAFTTRSANQLLLDQGVRVSNPSESIRQNVRSRKAFALSRGSFRVSQSGVTHLASLMHGGI